MGKRKGDSSAEQAAKRAKVGGEQATSSAGNKAAAAAEQKSLAKPDKKKKAAPVIDVDDCCSEDECNDGGCGDDFGGIDIEAMVELYESETDPLRKVHVATSLATLYNDHLGEFAESRKWFTKLAELRDAEGDATKKRFAQTDAAVTWLNEGNEAGLQKAIASVLTAAASANDTASQFYAYSAIAAAYINNEDTEKAITWSEKAIPLLDALPLEAFRAMDDDDDDDDEAEDKKKPTAGDDDDDDDDDVKEPTVAQMLQPGQLFGIYVDALTQSSRISDAIKFVREQALPRFETSGYVEAQLDMLSTVVVKALEETDGTENADELWAKLFELCEQQLSLIAKVRTDTGDADALEQEEFAASDQMCSVMALRGEKASPRYKQLQARVEQLFEKYGDDDDDDDDEDDDDDDDDEDDE